MFEFLLFFALIASLNFVGDILSAGPDSRPDFLVSFLIALLAAPLVFAHIIHLADSVFKCMGFKKNTWWNSIIAVIVAVSIGAAISFFFVHQYLKYFKDPVTNGVKPLPSY